MAGVSDKVTLPFAAPAFESPDKKRRIGGSGGSFGVEYQWSAGWSSALRNVLNKINELSALHDALNATVQPEIYDDDSSVSLTGVGTSFTAWTQATASLSRAVTHMDITVFPVRGSANGLTLVEIGVGASTAESAVFAQNYYTTATGNSYASTAPLAIATGSRITVRAKTDGDTGVTVDVGLSFGGAA